MRKILRISAVLAAVVTVAACGGSNSGELKDSKAIAVPEINEVEVITLEKGDFPHQLLSNGKLEATRKAVMSFSASGIVKELNVSNGSQVKSGQVIAELDRDALALSLESAQIAMQKAEFDLYDVLAGQGYRAKDTLNVPKDVLAMAKMRSGYSSVLNSLKRARADYEAAVLKAPFSGKIADLSTGRYERASGAKFCTVVDDSSFDVSFPVMESEYGFVAKGLPVRISPYADLSKTLHGEVTEINPLVDSNGQILVKARVRNDGSLIDGMNVKVVVERMLKDKMVVPRSAVVIRDNLDVLFTYTPDGKAHWVYVNILNSNSESHVVEANSDRGAKLSPGEQVIVSGNLNLADGSEVQLKK